MDKRGQATMEFLMTYGWAIIVFLIALGAITYLGSVFVALFFFLIKGQLPSIITLKIILWTTIIYALSVFGISIFFKSIITEKDIEKHGNFPLLSSLSSAIVIVILNVLVFGYFILVHPNWQPLLFRLAGVVYLILLIIITKLFKKSSVSRKVKMTNSGKRKRN